MTTRESLHTEIDNLSDKYLDELYQLVRAFVQSKLSEEASTLMDRLKRIQIDGPEDFAANLDGYLSGEKGLESDLR
ncbi:MAG TPA: hypothetical protein VNK95_01775 [Caldilineaceae bacterium]|nr:hypothetical protein [Caldilineaceae bacterium]